MINLAQSSPKIDNPIRTIIQQNRDRGVEPLTPRELPWGLLGVLALVALHAAVIAWWINRRARLAHPPKERAFLRIARKLGLDEQGRALIKELAAECELEPLTLLVSPTALRTALTETDRDKWRSHKGWKKVVALGEAA